MRIVSHLAVAASIVLFAATGANAKEIKKKQQFMDAVVGKKLVSGNTWVMVSADGKISGVGKDNAKVVGAWVWNKRYWCRNVVVGDKALPEDCQKVSIDGNQVTFTRNKGKGESGTFTISN